MITNLADCHHRPSGALTLDAVKAAAKKENAPHIVQAQDERWLVVTPGGAVMGTSQPYGQEESYDLAFRVALQREWGWPVTLEGVVGL